MINEETIRQRLSRRVVVLVLVAMAVVASLLVVLVAKPAHASTTFTVNLKSDEADTSKGDSLCDVAPSIPGPQCTLRAAIEEANATPGADAINFNIPGDGGVATIFPSTDLPPITGQVTMDGYTQPGASPNTLEEGTNAVLKIQLDGLDLVDRIRAG